MASVTVTTTSSDRLAQLRALDDTKAGDKGLVDAGISTKPSIFKHPKDPPSGLLPTQDSTAAVAQQPPKHQHHTKKLYPRLVK